MVKKSIFSGGLYIAFNILKVGRKFMFRVEEYMPMKMMTPYF
jgi:hypothetical protein